jgi:rhomboid protease GluP
MYYELALISVAIAGGYWGWFFLRQHATRLYGVMLLGSGVLSCLGLLGRKESIDALGVPGAIGVGAGTCLLILGPLVRGLARRAAQAERFGIADKLLTIADVLAPGSGVREEKTLLGAMQQIRDGNIEHTVGALEHAKRKAPDDAKIAIDERIAMLYLAAHRWDEAIQHAEAHVFGALPVEEPGPHVALRRALGVTPPLWVELLGAYGYVGDLEKSARMLARLEEACAGNDDSALWLHRGRLMFLALAGRPDAVRVLVEPKRARHMTSSARAYWVAVAHERHGDVQAAEAGYSKARALTRGRPRVLLDRAFERLQSTSRSGVELGDTAKQLVARVEAAPPPEVAARTRPPGMVATQILSAALIVPALVISLFVGPPTDVGVLLRSGALVRGLVVAEPWRLVSCIFIHVGTVHLVVNVLGLWFLGRLAEGLFGRWRLVAIFAVSGLVGSLASWQASPAGMSAGASGAIFGVLGALLVELTWQRKRYRGAWSRGIWGSLALVTVAQVAVGFFYPVTDQWAHGGGLVAGAALGVVMSPHLRGAKVMLHVARVLAIAFGLVVVGTAVMVARTSIADTLSHGPLVTKSLGGVTIRAPESWSVSDDELTDPDQLVVLAARHADGDLARSLESLTASELDHTHSLGFESAKLATERLVPLPAGWQGHEFALAATDALGAHQHFRLLVAGRTAGSGIILIALYVPETLARTAPTYFADMVGSVR